MFLNIIFRSNIPRYIFIFVDLIILYFSTFLLFDKKVDYFFIVGFSFVSILIIFLFNGYKIFNRFFSFYDILKFFLSFLISTFIFFILNYFLLLDLILNDILLIFFISFFSLSSYRICIKILYSKNIVSDNQKINTLLYGAGDSGVIAKRAFYNNLYFNIIGFIDDAKSFQNKSIDGINIFGIGKKLEKFIIKNNIQYIILTTEKFTHKRKKEILRYLNNLNLKVYELPKPDKWINNKPLISSLKEIKIEELLSRSPIKINSKNAKNSFNNKVIFVSGAAGSIGSEIVTQLTKFQPNKIILFDQAESDLFKFKNVLTKMKLKVDLEFIVGTLLNYEFLNSFFIKNKIDVVFHAAAYKHVIMLEKNIKTAIINNVLGSKNIIDISVKNNVKKFIMISTDKAVKPSSVMGASKRIAELYSSKTFNIKSDTKIVITRFGNVLGSNGSVVPIFREQIANGGPVTVTHPDVIRFFMTIPEASRLVLEAASSGNKSEIFVFDMGDPIKINDLATDMIRLSGLKVNEDIEIKYTGLRKGEKLYEEILTNSEFLKPSHHKLILIANQNPVTTDQLKLIDNLIDLALKDENDDVLKELMKKIVLEYKPLDLNLNSNV